MKLFTAALLIAITAAAVPLADRPPAMTPGSVELVALGCVVGAADTTKFECRYAVRWVDDPHGPIDSLAVRHSTLLNGVPQLVADLGRPSPPNPVGLKLSLPRPAPRTTLSGTVSAHLVRRGLPGPVAVANWSYTEPDIPPPAVTIDTLAVQALWVEPRAERDSLVNGQLVSFVGARDSVERCAFVQFGDSAVGRYSLGGARSANCAARLAAHVARWHGLSPKQQAIVDTLRAFAEVGPVGSVLAVVTTIGTPPMFDAAGWVPMRLPDALVPGDTLPTTRRDTLRWHRVRLHGMNGGGWRQTVLGYAR